MSTLVLVVNAGSSSLKVSVLELAAPQSTPLGTEKGWTSSTLVAGQVEGIGGTPRLKVIDDRGQVIHRAELGAIDALHGEALAPLLEAMQAHSKPWRPVVVGHRVVHGGAKFAAPVRIDEQVMESLHDLIPLAPLHQPAAIACIQAAREAFRNVPHVACFDTAFHLGHPAVADYYALPEELHQEGVRRYGFHGLSYEYVVAAMRRLSPTTAAGRMVVAHLGNGASLSAIRDGKSLENTMGFTALDGVPMGTRCGQIDPGVLLYLLQEKGYTADQLEHLLYHNSGLLGLSGVSGDMQTLLANESPAAALAVDYFVYRVAMAVASLAVPLGGLDTLVFTGGIGEHSAEIRRRVVGLLKWMGAELPPGPTASQGARKISNATSRVAVWVVPTDEEQMIARHSLRVVGARR